MRGHGAHRRNRRGRGRFILQPALLLMMHMGPAHGYELLDRLKGYGLVNIDPSLIYRALHTLEGEGLVSSTWDKEESQGPPRRVYSLTELGKKELDNIKTELEEQRDRIERLMQAYSDHAQNN